MTNKKGYIIFISVFVILSQYLTSWGEKSEFYPFTSELVKDPRLYINYRSFFRKKLLFIIPPINKDGAKEDAWLQDTLGKILYRGLAGPRPIPATNPLFSRDIPHREIKNKRSFPVIPDDMQIIDLERYLIADRRQNIQEIIKTQKKIKEKKDDAAVHFGDEEEMENSKSDFRAIYFPNWNDLMESSEQETDFLIINGPPATDYQKKYNRQNRDRQVQAPFFKKISKILLNKLRVYPKEIHSEILILAGNYQKLSPHVKNKSLNVNEGLEKYWQVLSSKEKSVEEIILKLYLFDVRTGEIVWHKESIFNSRGNWRQLLEIPEKIISHFFAANKGGLDLSQSASGFKVYLNSEYFGKTPIRLSSLTPGFYALSLKRDGFEASIIWVEIKKNKLLSLKPDLKPIVYNNSFKVSGTKGALVYIDGRKVGVIPCMTENISPGYHRLRIEAEGYVPQEKPFKMFQSTHEIVNIQLKALELDKVIKPEYYVIKKPYRGLNIFTSGNSYEITSKYFLAASVLSFTGAIISNGISKRNVDSYAKPQENSAGFSELTTKAFLGLGVCSLITSGTFLYLSFQKDDELFSSLYGLEKTMKGFGDNTIIDFFYRGPDLPQSAQDMNFNFLIGVRF